MFQQQYYVPKSTDTYADSMVAWGFATVLEDVLNQADQPNANRITLSDGLSCYIVELPVPLREEWINKAVKTPLTYFIARNTQQEGIPQSCRIVYMDDEWDKVRKRQEAKKAAITTDTQDADLKEMAIQIEANPFLSHFITAQKLSGDEPANKICNEVDKANYSELLRALLALYSGIAAPLTGFTQNTTATLLNPAQGMGINDLAPKGAGGGKLKAPWPVEWLKGIGFYTATFCASFQNTKKQTIGIEVAVLSPQRISLRNHRAIRDRFMASFYAKSSLKLECLAVLNYADEFLNHSAEAAEWRGEALSNVVSGFATCYFMDVRQGVNFAVKRITFLEMPVWIYIPQDGNIDAYRDAIQEHIKCLRPLDDNRGETRAILQAYRDWSSSGQLSSLWEFTSAYGIYRVACATDIKLPFQPHALTTKNLEVILMNQAVNDKPLAPVLSDEGFQNVAKAIRSSTINAIYQKQNKSLASGMEVHYGLAQELRRIAPYKEKFVSRLMQHLQTYNEENARAAQRPEANKDRPQRKNISTQDIERIIQMIDDYGSPTMCGLLLAYGYAKDPKEDPDKS